MIKKLLVTLLFICSIAMPDQSQVACNAYCGGAPSISQVLIVKSSGGDGADCMSSTGLAFGSFSGAYINKNPNALYSVTSDITDSCVSNGFVSADQTFFIMAVNALTDDGLYVIGSGNTSTPIQMGFSSVASRRSFFPALIFSNACSMNSLSYCFICTCSQ